MPATSVESSPRPLRHPADIGPTELLEAAISATALTDQLGGLGHDTADLWLDRLVDFVSAVEVIAAEHHGNVVGCLPAGVLIRHAAGRAADAVNTAIDIQERFAGLIDCSIGIATGPVLHTVGGTVVGEPVMAASRLCAAATGGAILVDHATVSYANLTEIRSAAGIDDHRRPADYIAGSHYLPITASYAAAYSEVLWSARRHGLHPQAITDVTIAHLARPGACQVGTVRSWDAGKDRGFVVADSGEHFYSDDRFLADGPPESGSRVVFVARPAAVKGKSRVAAALTPVGGLVTGTVLQRDNRRWFVVADPQGNRVILPFDGSRLGACTATIALLPPTDEPWASPVD